MDKVSPEQRSRNMANVRNKNTAPEKLVRSLLHRLGYRFRLHRRDLPGTPDICLPGKRAVILVHGCFWHGHDCRRGALPTSNRPFWEEKIGKNISRDQRAQKALEADGWKALTIWECEIKDQEAVEQTLVAFLKADAIE